MSTPIILQDYSKITDEKIGDGADAKSTIDFCKEIQTAIDQGKFNILNLADFMEGDTTLKKATSKTKKKGDDGDDDDDGVYPKVFGTYNNAPYTKKYAGILEYKGQTVVINSRFDKAPTGDGDNDKTYFLQYALEKIGWKKLRVRYFMDMSIRGGLGLLTQLLIPLFLYQVQEAYQVGVYRQYRNFEHNDSKFRGPIDIPRHIRLNPLSNGNIAYNTRDYTIDNPTNHLILQTMAVLEQRAGSREILQSILTENPELRAPFQRLGWELGIPSVKRSQINGIIADNRNSITHPFHRRYEQVRKTALMILREEGLQLMTQEEDHQVNALLIPMDRVWELLLECTMFPKKKGGVTAQKSIGIVSDTSSKWNPRRILKPDFYEDGGHYVLDAKYRIPWMDAYTEGKWTSYVRNDVFQVFAYLYTAKTIHDRPAVCGGVVFPYPRKKLEDKVGAVKEFSIFKGDFNDRFYLVPYPVELSEHYTSYQMYQRAMDGHCNFENPESAVNMMLGHLTKWVKSDEASPSDAETQQTNQETSEGDIQTT